MAALIFLAHRIPYPPDKGEKIRAYHVPRHLAKRFRVHLGCFADDPKDEQHARAMDGFCASVFVLPLDRRLALARGLCALAAGGSLSQAYFRDPRMARWVDETVARVNPAALFVFCSSMAPYAFPHAGRHRVLVDMVDVDSEKFRAYGKAARWPAALVYARESRALLALERRAALIAERCFFVSREEADTFLASAPEAAGRIGFFQNGVDLEHFDPAKDHGDPFPQGIVPIVFTGNMDYRPNVEAVEWFATRVLPAVKGVHPKAQFWIVGANPVPRVRKLEQDAAVRVTGRVEDVRPFLARAACVVAPLKIGRGLQNKVLEAMAMARPVVVTGSAFEGLSAMAGRDLLLADAPEAFAAAVSSVLAGQADALGRSARLLVETHYNWERNLAVLDHVLDGGGIGRSRPESARWEGDHMLRVVS